MQLTPEEYAKELVNKFFLSGVIFITWKLAKEFAIVAIDEMINLYSSLVMTENSLLHQYLLDTKKEIEAL